MVNLTSALFKYRPFWLLPDPNAFTSDKRAFRRLNLFKLTQKFHGRHRNCYKIAINRWHKSLDHSYNDRQDRKIYMKDIYSQRLWAALNELRFPYKYFLGVLPRAGIELDRRVLAHLCVWEPRTFEALVDICRAFVVEHPVGDVSEKVKKPDGVITRDML